MPGDGSTPKDLQPGKPEGGFTMTPQEKAQEGVTLLKEAVIAFLETKPKGATRLDIDPAPVRGQLDENRRLTLPLSVLLMTTT
jgi:hypothetical protein